MNSLLLVAALSATFTVENKQSAFTVVNMQTVSFTAENKQVTTPAVVKVASPRYTVRRVRWNVNGDMNPSHATLLAHMQSGQHYGKWSAGWLSSLSYIELRSLHDDDHEGRVNWSLVQRPTAQPTVAKSAVQFTYRRNSACPNGRCPR